MLVCSALLTMYTANLLLKVRKVTKGTSYTQIGKSLYGKWGVIGVNFALVGSQLGFCCSYVYFIMVNFNHVFY